VSDTPFDRLLAEPASGDDPIARSRAMDRLYHATFSTEPGQAVLRDMYERFVNVDDAVPREPDLTYMRAGRRSVVIEIARRIRRATREDEENG